MAKLKKDKMVSIRINSKILQKIKQTTSVQKIIDEYVSKNITVSVKIDSKK